MIYRPTVGYCTTSIYATQAHKAIQYRLGELRCNLCATKWKYTVKDVCFWACFCNLISQNVRNHCIPEVQQFWMRMTGGTANIFVYKPIQNCNFCQPESSMLLLTIIWRLHGAVVAIIHQCCWLWCSSLINSMQRTYVSWTISLEICFLQQEKGWDSRAVEKGKEHITVLHNPLFY